MEAADILKAETLAPFIGRDFLTWLWFYTDQKNGLFQSKTGQDFALFLEQRISVLGGEGESLDTAVSSGPLSELREAKLGLQTGKKVNQARIRMEQDENSWLVQVKGEDFCLTGLKTPKVDLKLEEGEDPDARFLEKMYLIEKSLEILDEIFALFLELRLSSDWSRIQKEMREWIGK
ncbi:MAG: hypothetical protein K9K64_10350 [Desulfohalobiaceae bacterium]|nr:hypothetical protein [Desulfohalobiaceae bacterium]